MGTPWFAVESLKALVENGYNIVGVITAPDKPAGRGQKISQSAVKQYAAKQGLYILQPEKLKDTGFRNELKALNADLQIVVAFRMLPREVWAMPPMGTFNLHASLLPQYRGAAPINRAIINGETETGLTTFLLSHEIDTGKILFAEKTKIEDHETAGDLHDRLMVKGAKLVVKTVNALAKGSVIPVTQDELITSDTVLHPAPRLFREDMKIDWQKPANEVRNLIRGLSPYPAAWTTLVQTTTGKETELKIFYAEMAEGGAGIPGTIKSDGVTCLKVACADGWLNITDLQLSGKKRLKIDEFLRGFANQGNFSNLFHLSF